VCAVVCLKARKPERSARKTHMTHAQIIEKRNKLMADATALNSENANKETRAKVKALMLEAEELNQDAEVAQKLEAHAAEVRAVTQPPRGEAGEVNKDASTQRRELEKRAFANFITGRIKPEDHQYLQYEKRDLTVGAAGATTGGGVLVPVGYDNLLHTATKSIGDILSGVRTWNTDSGEGMRVSLTDPSSLRFALVAENTTVGETDPTFTGFTSYVDTLGFSTRVSNQLLQDSAFSVDQFLSDTISYAWAATASEAIIKGNGSNFQSLVSGAALGYTTATGDTTQLGYDDLLGIFKALEPNVLNGEAAWWMHSSTWASLLDIKDDQARPILTTDLQGNPFKSLFGVPIRISQAIDRMGASKNPVLLGDASRSYTYRQAGPLVIRKATERYIDQNATGFFAFQRAGGYSTVQSTTPYMIKLATAAS
jgi:HK97 family phage major capsid protein